MEHIGKNIYFHGNDGISRQAQNTQGYKINDDERREVRHDFHVLDAIGTGYGLIFPNNRENLDAAKIPDQTDQNGHDGTHHQCLTQYMIGVPDISSPQIANDDNRGTNDKG